MNGHNASRVLREMYILFDLVLHPFFSYNAFLLVTGQKELLLPLYVYKLVLKRMSCTQLYCNNVGNSLSKNTIKSTLTYFRLLESRKTCRISRRPLYIAFDLFKIKIRRPLDDQVPREHDDEFLELLFYGLLIDCFFVLH
jgi:hypothetical protein